jgi:hypothetical protein
MLDYIFNTFSIVYFHIGNRIRSQIAIKRLGVTKIGEQKSLFVDYQNYVLV